MVIGQRCKRKPKNKSLKRRKNLEKGLTILDILGTIYLVAVPHETLIEQK